MRTKLWTLYSRLSGEMRLHHDTLKEGRATKKRRKVRKLRTATFCRQTGKFPRYSANATTQLFTKLPKTNPGSKAKDKVRNTVTKLETKSTARHVKFDKHDCVPFLNHNEQSDSVLTVMLFHHVVISSLLLRAKTKRMWWTSKCSRYGQKHLKRFSSQISKAK